MSSHTRPEPATWTVSMAGSVQKGPDGTPWPVLHIISPLIQTALFMPIDAARQFAEQIPTMIGDLIHQAERTTSGIIVGEDPQMAKAVDDILKGKHRA